MTTMQSDINRITAALAAAGADGYVAAVQACAAAAPNLPLGVGHTTWPAWMEREAQRDALAMADPDMPASRRERLQDAVSFAEGDLLACTPRDRIDCMRKLATIADGAEADHDFETAAALRELGVLLVRGPMMAAGAAFPYL